MKKENYDYTVKYYDYIDMVKRLEIRVKKLERKTKINNLLTILGD